MNDRILIIDDDPVLLEKFQEFLHRVGYEVEMLTGNGNALEWVEKIKARAILLDLEMAPRNGSRAADQVKRVHRRKKIGIMSMSRFFSRKEHSFMMKESGIEEFLIKPFSPIHLISKIQFILPQKKMDTRRETFNVWEDLN